MYSDDYDDKNQISGVSYSPFFINEIKEEEKGEWHSDSQAVSCDLYPLHTQPTYVHKLA